MKPLVIAAVLLGVCDDPAPDGAARESGGTGRGSADTAWRRGGQVDAETDQQAIELLEMGQPIYYARLDGDYEDGRRLALTQADYITYNLQHSSFDMTRRWPTRRPAPVTCELT